MRSSRQRADRLGRRLMISDSISHTHTSTHSVHMAIVHCPLEIGLGLGLGLDRTGLDSTRRTSRPEGYAGDGKMHWLAESITRGEEGLGRKEACRYAGTCLGSVHGPKPLGIIVMEMTGGRTLSTGIPVWKAIPAVLVGFCLQAAVAWNTSVNVQGSGFTLSLCLERQRLPPAMHPGHPHAFSTKPTPLPIRSQILSRTSGRQNARAHTAAVCPCSAALRCCSISPPSRGLLPGLGHTQ